MIDENNKLCLIEWMDPYTFSDKWESISEMPNLKNTICVSVGWIMKETKDNILIIPHISDIGNKNSLGTGCGAMVIPKLSIVKRKKLKYNEDMIIKLVIKLAEMLTFFYFILYYTKILNKPLFS